MVKAVYTAVMAVLIRSIELELNMETLIFSSYCGYCLP
jgi:hypothetical protein